jgi:hypothetical protein
MSIKIFNRYILLIALFSLILQGCTNNTNQFSTVTQKFEDSVHGELALCFYPSTIQMLNTKKDTTFNKVFKDIKKLKVVRFSRSSDTTKNVVVAKWADQLRKEKYIDLLRFRQGKQDVMVFLYKYNNEPKKFFGIVSDSSQVFMVDLVGTIPMKYISEIAKGDLNLGGFSSVINFNKPTQNLKHRNK